MSLRFLVFAASHRPDSFNRKLARLAARSAETLGASVDFAEYGEFDTALYNDGEAEQGYAPPAALAFLDRMALAQGVIIASPEYNWSYPGSLKNLLDWTSRLDPAPMRHKTALLLCATPGARGGILGLDHLRSVLAAMQLQVFNRAFPLGHCHEALSAEGGLTSEKQRLQLDTLLADYVTFTRKLAN